MTQGQRKALETHWGRYGLDPDEGALDPGKVFGTSRPVVVEIGFGMGDSLFEMAQQQPDNNFIGIEVHRPGVGHLLNLAASAALENLRVYNADSVPVLDRCIASASLDRVQVFFPDPWHKKRHHKRRLIGPSFATTLHERLKTGGIVHVATDWPDYAENIRETMAGIPYFESVSPPGRPVTKYERRGIAHGHPIIDLAWRRAN